MNTYALTFEFDPLTGSRTAFKCTTCNSRLYIHYHPHPSIAAVLLCPVCFDLQPQMSLSADNLPPPAIVLSPPPTFPPQCEPKPVSFED